MRRDRLAPFGRHRIDRGVTYTVVAGPGANVRRRCYLVVGDEERSWGAELPWDRYRWIDADTGAQFAISLEGMARAMYVPTDQAARYATDLDSFGEEAFTSTGWQPEPCPDRLCPIDTPHHHSASHVRHLDHWPWDHPKARPLDDLINAAAGWQDAPVTCLECRQKLNGRQNFGEPDSDDIDGDVSICLYCSSLAIYAPDEPDGLRLPTDAERFALEVDDAVQAAVAETRRWQLRQQAAHN